MKTSDNLIDFHDFELPYEYLDIQLLDWRAQHRDVCSKLNEISQRKKVRLTFLEGIREKLLGKMVESGLKELIKRPGYSIRDYIVQLIDIRVL